MRINLTQEEFECLWKNCPSFKERVWKAFDTTDVSAPTFDSLVREVEAKHTGSKISAIKFVREWALQYRPPDPTFEGKDGKRYDINSLLGAKTFVEEKCDI